MKALKLEGRSVSEVEIENTLEALQKEVEGYIETLTIAPDKAVMIVNEEGRIRGMAPNPIASGYTGIGIVGPALIVGVDGDEFCDVPAEIISQLT